jgi:hypothetical protein
MSKPKTWPGHLRENRILRKLARVCHRLHKDCKPTECSIKAVLVTLDREFKAIGQTS